jgi:hypothetical protein
MYSSNVVTSGLTVSLQGKGEFQILKTDAEIPVHFDPTVHCQRHVSVNSESSLTSLS